MSHGKKFGFAAVLGDFAHARFGLVRVAADERDRRAGFGISFGDRAAQFAGAANHHCHFALK
jgi:hypothetical protein